MGRPTTPAYGDCSKSVYAGDLSREEDWGRARAPRSSLRRSQSTKMLRGERRSPYDHLPEAPEKPLGGTMGRHPRDQAQHPYPDPGFGPDPAYSEYIRRKNAAADQCSGSSSGYYISSKEQERAEMEEGRRRGPSLGGREDFRALRRDRSLTRDFRDPGGPRGPRGGPDFLPRPHGGPTPPIGPPNF